MERFHGEVGYATQQEIAPGVWDDVITEKPYYGDVVKNSARFAASGQSVNDTLTVGVSISVLADDELGGHIFAIRYVRWAGALWEVAEVTPERPRLRLRLGGVYNGPTV